MRGEGGHRVELAFEPLLLEQRVNVRETGRAGPGDAGFDILPLKLALVAFVCMTRARNQMMSRANANQSPAEFARCGLHGV